MAEKLAEYRARKETYEALVWQMEASGQTEVSLTDGEARGMQRVGVGYNVQVAVDGKHHLIAVNEVAQAANDRGQLSGMAVMAKAELGVQTLQAVADGGYHEAGEIERSEAAGIETYVNAPGSSSGQSTQGAKVYPKEAFVYQAANDSYRCPSGQEMKPGYRGQSQGKERIYYYNVAACGACPHKAQCTQGRYRKISRLVNEAVVERQAARVAAHPEIVKRRKAIVEHVFGTLRLWSHDVFLMKGLEKVRAEFALSALAYNLRRVLNLMSVAELLAAVGGGVVVA